MTTRRTDRSVNYRRHGNGWHKVYLQCSRETAFVACNHLIKSSVNITGWRACKDASRHWLRQPHSNQFANPANLQAHVTETGPELVRQIETLTREFSQIIFVKGAGTGASFQGIATSLREKFANVRCELVMPEGCDLRAGKFADHRPNWLLCEGVGKHRRWKSDITDLSGLSVLFADATVAAELAVSVAGATGMPNRGVPEDIDILPDGDEARSP